MSRYVYPDNPVMAGAWASCLQWALGEAELLAESWSTNDTNGYCYATPDGLVQDVQYRGWGGNMSPCYKSSDGEWVETVAGSWVLRNRSSVKETRVLYSPSQGSALTPQ